MTGELIAKSRFRLKWAGAILMVGALLLMVQLLRWTIWPQPNPSRASTLLWIPQSLAEQQKGKVRGNILDTHGSLIVGTGSQWEVTLTPIWVESHQAGPLAEVLSPLVGIPVEALREVLLTNKEYAMIGLVNYEVGWQIRQMMLDARNRSDDDPPEVRALKALPWRAVTLTSKPVRVYPEKSLVAHALGFVNAELKAFYGVEYYYDKQLRGDVGLDLSRQGKPLSEMGWRFEQNASPDAPCDLVLTIDRAAQYVVEKELIKTVQEFNAEGGTILVLNPKTGAIIASASYPGYEPGRYGDYPDRLWEDPAISKQYEPGSIFKLITLAAGLNAGVITPYTTYVDTGCTVIGGRQICNLRGRSYGLVTMQDVLTHSLNVGTTYINTLLGPDDFYTYVERFGFGTRTGVDLAGELSGLVRKPGDANWYKADLGTNSYGQGIAVTPLQMVSAVGAIANKGELMRPHIVKGFISNGKMMEVTPSTVRQVIRADTAETLTRMMVEAIDAAVPAAQVPGFSVAAKSGTADIPGPNGYGQHGTWASFIGFLPASDPEFAILVKIDRPQGKVLGSEVAGPAFGNIAAQLVTMAGLTPDRPAR